jgi:hypothetical protein
LAWGERTHEAIETRGLPMQSFEQFVSCAEVSENTDSCRFFQVIGKNHKLLKSKQIFGPERQEKGGSPKK